MVSVPSQGTLKNVAMGVDEARKEGYAWKNGNVSGRNELRSNIGFFSRSEGDDTAIT